LLGQYPLGKQVSAGNKNERSVHAVTAFSARRSINKRSNGRTPDTVVQLAVYRLLREKLADPKLPNAFIRQLTFLIIGSSVTEEAVEALRKALRFGDKPEKSSLS
jgi:hypothetical protein